MRTVTIWELAHHLLSAGAKVDEVTRRVNRHRATIYRWQKTIRYRGIRRFVREAKEAKRKRHKRCLDSRVVRLIKQSRTNHHDWCGEKIVWELRTKYGIRVSRASVYRVLGRYFKLRSKWKKNKTRGPLPQAFAPRDVIQADTVDYGELFAYTAVDIYTREICVILGDNLTAEEGRRCVGQIFNRLGPCTVFQTDNGGEFATECDKIIKKYAHKHHRNHARRKNENAYIESFNRTFRKECLGWAKYKLTDKARLQQMVDEYIKYYNTERPHLGLGLKIPAEVAKSHLF
ncbi:transposase [Candidatus Curtissbacteria bacterium]|nr:transposase [Candidatus Curtissbacteria bacterium]